MTLSPILREVFTRATKNWLLLVTHAFPVQQGNTAHVTKHGFGYSVFEHSETGIVSDALILPIRSIKFCDHHIHNTSGPGA